MVKDECNSSVKVEQDELELMNPEALDGGLGSIEGVILEKFIERWDTLKDEYENNHGLSYELLR